MDLSNRFKLLADLNRLRIFNLIIDKDLCSCEIETILELSQSNTSRHLNKLKSLSFIETYKDGNWVHYTLNEKEKNNMLIKYVRQEFLKEEIFIKDKERLKKYKNSPMTCTIIREDKEKVLNFLKISF
ncbi:MAG: metalloregulator ArsR/SmtB family transcription factor [Eubacteriales bacterium]